MEIRIVFAIIRRWVWLFILGIIIGASVGRLLSDRQTKSYRSSTRVQVMSSANAGNNVYAYFNDQQLAKTYAQTLATRPNLDLVEKQLGIRVSGGHIKIRNVAETQLIDINVEYTNPQQAADIANTLVRVFAEETKKIQASRFSEAEQSLQAQIDQVDNQIQALQSQAFEVSSEENEETLKKAGLEIAKLQEEILFLQNEIYQLSPPPPSEATWVTPRLTVEDQWLLNEKILRLEQLQNMHDSYQQVYTNLVVLGSASEMGENRNSNGSLQSTLALYEQIRSNLLASYEDVRLARLNSTSNIVQVEPALPNNSPIRPQTSRDVTMGAVIGALFAAMVVFLIEYLDDSVKTPEQITDKLNLPVIGYIAKMEQKNGAPFITDNPHGPIAEALRTMRTNIEFSGVEKPIKSVLIVSPNPGEGKSTIAANLSVAMAQGGKRVILIDVDLRRPKIHLIFKLLNRVGLSDFFIGSVSLEDIIQRWKDPNLSIITSGAIPPNPADLLASNKMAGVLNACKKLADITIVDAPPFLVTDAAILASHVDGVILLVESGKTQMRSCKTAVENLGRAGARIIGVVMNRIPHEHSYYYGGYQFYSSRYLDKYYYDNHAPNEIHQKREPLLKTLMGKMKNSSNAESIR